MNDPHPFLSEAARLFNSNQTRVVIVGGNVHDLFFLEREDSYVPLPDLIQTTWSVAQRLVITYEINGPIRFQSQRDRQTMKDAWLRWRTGADSGDLALQSLIGDRHNQEQAAAAGRSFDEHLRSAVGKPTVALELMRQFCCCSRTASAGLNSNLIIIIEAADLIVPDAPINQLGDADRQRVHILHDWFSDPGFMNGGDVVTLLSESRSLLNQRIATLPQVLDVTVPDPDQDTRRNFIGWFHRGNEGHGTSLPDGEEHDDDGVSYDFDDLARRSAGLNLHALRQLLSAGRYNGGSIQASEIVDKVEQYICAQLGEDVVSFSKPHHRLTDCIGCAGLKKFLQTELIPRFKEPGPGAIPGAAIGGPIGAGKTFIFEAVAAELDMPVLVLKNIRSQWFGQTDVILERLRRVLESLDRVVIFVDEADTQFGGVGPDAHSTERRLTGKIQAMMSDPKLLGKVYWLLMTARIHLLSPDIRRPGRVGDLIIPVLDPPTNEDRDEFVTWTLKPALGTDVDTAVVTRIRELTSDFSAAGYAALRRELQAKGHKSALSVDDVQAIINDHLPPAITTTRRYQTLQALVNCTRRSLLPDPTISDAERHSWEEEINRLEAQGIR